MKKIILEGRLEIECLNNSTRAWLDNKNLPEAIRATLLPSACVVSDNELWQRYSPGRVRITIKSVEEEPNADVSDATEYPMPYEEDELEEGDDEFVAGEARFLANLAREAAVIARDDELLARIPRSREEAEEIVKGLSEQGRTRFVQRVLVSLAQMTSVEKV